MGLFMFMTALGPEVGPIISGFVSLASWRWTFWRALIIAGSALPVILLLPETYAPVLAQRSQRDAEHFRQDLQTTSELQKKSRIFVFARPFLMVVREPILLMTSLYLALVYGTLYLFMQAYPLIFQGFIECHRHNGRTGLTLARCILDVCRGC
jgi:MFS family permease